MTTDPVLQTWALGISSFAASRPVIVGRDAMVVDAKKAGCG